jgi:hypothetical protein
MAFSTAYDARVVSVRDFDYVIPVHSSFHPAFKSAAKLRIQKMFPNFRKAIGQAFANRAASRVWGILIEDAGQPVCVVQNLACVVRNQSYRRLLRVDLNNHYPSNNPIIDTSFLTRNSRPIVGSAPETSTTTVQ